MYLLALDGIVCFHYLIPALAEAEAEVVAAVAATLVSVVEMVIYLTHHPLVSVYPSVA